MGAYHGKESRVLISTTGSTAAVTAQRVTDWSIDMSVDTVEITALGNTNKIYLQGLPNFQGSFNAIYDDGFDNFFQARRSSDGCKMYFYPNFADTATYLYAEVWLSLSMTGGISDAVKLACQFLAKSNFGEVGFGA